MNIRDFRTMDLPATKSSDRLVLTFKKQLELREKYVLIETNNGFYCPLSIDFHATQDQQVLKDLAWRTTEELAEAFDAAYKHPEGWAHDHAKEEVADAFHFLVEMAVISEIDPLQYQVEGKPGDSLTRIFSYGLHICNTIAGPEPLPSMLMTNFVMSLGMTCHTLKNKPWKQSQMVTDVDEYKKRLSETFYHFAAFCHSIRLNDAELFDLYHRKAQVNEFRQRSNY